MNGRRVPEIMQSRLVARVTVPLDAGIVRRRLKAGADRRIGQRRAVALG